MSLFCVIAFSSVCHGASRDYSARATWRKDFRRERIEARHTVVTAADRREAGRISALLPHDEYRLKGLRIDNARHRQGEGIRYRKQLSESAKQSMTHETDIQTGRAMGTQGADSHSSFLNKKRKKLHGNLF